MAKRPVFLAAVTALTAAIVVSVTLFGFPPGRSDPEAFAHLFTKPENGNQTHLHVDADPTNGTRPCDPLDSTRTVQVGDTYEVALCLETYAPNAVEAFKLRLYYDSINVAPDPDGDEEPAGGGAGPGCGSCLDDNPDGNDGDSAAGLSLGGNWDCSGFTIFPPLGDDPATACVDEFGRPVVPCHDAVISCNANIAGPDMDLSANPGLLAMVQFTATGEGTEVLTWGDDTEIGGELVSLPDGGYAYCGPIVPEDQIACFGATIRKVRFDCLFEDPGRGTSLGLFGDEWEFDFPGGAAEGSGRVRRIGNWTIVTSRQSGLILFAFGNCPSGPARAFALDFSQLPPRILRLSDTAAVD